MISSFKKVISFIERYAHSYNKGYIISFEIWGLRMGLLEIRGESVLDTNRKMNKQYFKSQSALNDMTEIVSTTKRLLKVNT